MIRRLAETLKFICSLFLWGATLLAQATTPPTINRVQMERFGKSGSRFFLEGDYGATQLKQKLFAESLPTAGIAEMKWGFGTVEPQRGDFAYVDERYAFGSYMRPSWSPSKNSETAIGGDLWRLGFGVREGYGYWPGRVLIVPTFLWGLNWARWAPEPPAGISLADSSIIARYDRRVCFSALGEAGVKIQFGWNISVVGGYEFGVIYPRFVLPEWAGSFTLVATAEAIAGLVSSGLVRDAPGIAPLVHAILKGAIAYGYYTLCRSNMNWPFPSETPLTIEGYKVGVSVRF